MAFGLELRLRLVLENLLHHVRKAKSFKYFSFSKNEDCFKEFNRGSEERGIEEKQYVVPANESTSQIGNSHSRFQHKSPISTNKKLSIDNKE